MNYLPISAIFFRHLRLLKNYANRLIFTFYWPLLDILIWGFMGKWLSTHSSNTEMELVLLLSILLWSVFARIGQDNLTSLFEELWSNNLLNIFASPIKLSEWIIGALLFMILLFVLLMTFLIAVTVLLYDISVVSLLSNFVLFAPFMLLAGMSISFLILSIVIYFGLRAIEISYAVMWAFMPFSGVFYPIESLPTWAQKISTLLPMTYVFIAMREYFSSNTNPAANLFKSFMLSLIYGILFLMLFFYMFHKSKNNGLARLSD